MKKKRPTLFKLMKQGKQALSTELQNEILSTLVKIIWKCVKGLSVRQLLEETQGKFQDTIMGNDFINRIPETQQMTARPEK